MDLINIMFRGETVLLNIFFGDETVLLNIYFGDEMVLLNICFEDETVLLNICFGEKRGFVRCFRENDRVVGTNLLGPRDFSKFVQRFILNLSY
ncbi:hypothetical protein HanIR_Chr09g0405411 [Helianthus annuus]|nr:hypothetical protein HanIR_Chr09g0405411 [Helianthus annuus]